MKSARIVSPPVLYEPQRYADLWSLQAGPVYIILIQMDMLMKCDGGHG